MDPQTNLNIQLFERLGRIEEKQDAAVRRLDEYHKEIAGNGRPGLKQQVEELVLWKVELQSKWETILRVLTWAGALIGTCGTIFGIMTTWVKRHG